MALILKVMKRCDIWPIKNVYKWGACNLIKRPRKRREQHNTGCHTNCNMQEVGGRPRENPASSSFHRVSLEHNILEPIEKHPVVDLGYSLLTDSI